MDGNRRFAETHLGTQNAAEGHAAGYAALLSTLEWCLDLGVRTVSVFAFSVDNFSRPQQEVDALMDLAREKLGELAGGGGERKAGEEEATAATRKGRGKPGGKEDKEEDGGMLLQRHGVQLRVLGELSRLPPAVAEAARAAEKATESGSKARLNVCLAYSSTREIADAVSRISRSFSRGGVLVPPPPSPAALPPASPTTPLLDASSAALAAAAARGEPPSLTPSPSQSPPPAAAAAAASATTTEETAAAEAAATGTRSSFSPSSPPSGLIDRALYTAGCPPVDLLLRTSGESRLSDFLLWQSRHATLVFGPRLWPELRFLDVARAVVAFQRASPMLGELRRATEEGERKAATASRTDNAVATAEASDAPSAAPTPASAPAPPAAPAPAPSRGGAGGGGGGRGGGGGGGGVPRRVRGSRNAGGVRAQALIPSSSKGAAAEGGAAAAAAAAAAGREAPPPPPASDGDKDKDVLDWASRSTWRIKRRGDAEVEDEEGAAGPDDHGFDPHCPCCLTTGGRLIDGAPDDAKNLVMPDGLEKAMLAKKRREAEVRAAMAAARAERERKAREQEEEKGAAGA